MNESQMKIILEGLLTQSENRIGDGYLSKLRSYVHFASQGGDLPANPEYLFNILRELGHLKMAGLELSDTNLGAKTKELFELRVRDDGPTAPTFIDFDELEMETERYEAMWKEMKERIPDTRRLTVEPEKEEVWEEMWRELKDCGLTLLLSGLDVVAVRQGYQTIKNNATVSDGWKSKWDEFEGKASEFLEQLCRHKDLFYPFADNVSTYLADYPDIPEGKFRNLILAITNERENYPAEINYRRIFSPNEAEELYYATKERMEERRECLSAARAIYYRSALAEEVLKKFILRVCYAKQRQCNGSDFSTADWKLEGTQDIEYSKIPVLLAGQKQFSIHMLGPRVSGWGVRKDKIQPYLSNDETGFEGALFCSWKDYATEEVLVRFDNYMERERFAKLLQEKRGEEFEEFVRLSPDEVYAEDKRKQFFQMAANAVMGLEDSLILKFLLEVIIQWHQKQLTLEMVRQCYAQKIAEHSLVKSKQIQLQQIIVRELGEESEEIELPTLNSVLVEYPDKWDNIFFTHENEDKNLERNLEKILDHLSRNRNEYWWNGLYLKANQPYIPKRILEKADLLDVNNLNNIENFQDINNSWFITVFFSLDDEKLNEILKNTEEAYKGDNPQDIAETSDDKAEDSDPVYCINYLLVYNVKKATK